jgi:hypothetical protein
MQMRVSHVSNVEPSRKESRLWYARKKLSCAAQSASPPSRRKRKATRVIFFWYWRTKYSKSSVFPARISRMSLASSAGAAVSRAIMGRADTCD